MFPLATVGFFLKTWIRTPCYTPCRKRVHLTPGVWLWCYDIRIAVLNYSYEAPAYTQLTSYPAYVCMSCQKRENYAFSVFCFLVSVEWNEVWYKRTNSNRFNNLIHSQLHSRLNYTYTKRLCFLYQHVSTWSHVACVIRVCVRTYISCIHGVRHERIIIFMQPWQHKYIV